MISLDKEIYENIEYFVKISGLPGLGWYLLSTIPNPPKNEINDVVHDIIYNKLVGIKNVQLRHLPDCNSDHKIKNDIIRKAIYYMQDINYKVAVYPNGKYSLLYGQPIAIALSPEISKGIYPKHPHLNGGGVFNNFYFPNLFCYTNDPLSLGNKLEEDTMQSSRLYYYLAI